VSLQPQAEWLDIIRRALVEDIGTGDITSALLIGEQQTATMAFVAREPMVACGTHVATLVFSMLDPSVVCTVQAAEGAPLATGDILATARGNARSLLAGERVTLNIMQRLSGIATQTQRYVQAVAGTKAVILDTRKTMPNLRVMDKYAVQVGGGRNHRFRLDDMMLIKDNHLALCGGVAQAVGCARAGTALPVVVECDTLEQVQAALAAKPDRILLDNMSLSQLSQAVAMAAGVVPLEASGGVSLETVKAIAETGVNYISVGKLTHSVISADIGADIVFDNR
jgi:nicotinate-nucleotide pyrophosphorylase (carboxylating)